MVGADRQQKTASKSLCWRVFAIRSILGRKRYIMHIVEHSKMPTSLLVVRFDSNLLQNDPRDVPLPTIGHTAGFGSVVFPPFLVGGWGKKTHIGATAALGSNKLGFFRYQSTRGGGWGGQTAKNRIKIALLARFCD